MKWQALLHPDTAHAHIMPHIRPLSAFLLTNAKVCVDACVACSASQVLVLPVGDVLVGACVTVLLCQPKVNDVDKVALLPETHEEVVRLYVTVDEVL